MLLLTAISHSHPTNLYHLYIQFELIFDFVVYLDTNMRLLYFLSTLVLVLSRRHLKQAAKNESPDHKTVVESNHFYSNFQTFTNYQINNVQKDKSLIFILKQGDKTEKDLNDNPITISLLSGTDSQTCIFKSPRNMCNLNNVQQTAMKLKLECKKTPCELSWFLLQPASFSKDGLHQIDQLVQINQDFNHATLVASCNDPNLKTFSSDLKLYTNSAYQKIDNKGIIYYLFDNEQKGYYFITTDNPATRSCAKLSLRHTPDQIVFNTKDNITEDFISPSHTNSYAISKIPVTDFRIDSFFHLAKAQNLTADSGVQIELVGYSSQDERKVLSKVTVNGQENKNAVDLSVVFKKPAEQYKSLSIDITSKGSEILVISMNFVAGERQEVNLGETSYFMLKKGQKVNYKLLGESQEQSDSKKSFIFSSDDNRFNLSLVACFRKIGCQFSVQALEEGEGYIYVGQGESKNQKETVVVQFDRTVSKKIREGQQILLKKLLKAKKAVQFVVNSPNIIIYTSTKTNCQIPSAECHEKVLNSHNPIIYQPTADVQLFLLVEGLDNCEFTLTSLDEGDQFVQIFDSKPFTYLFDDSEKQLIFKFKLTAKMDVNFNLIAPLNQLNLIVFNTDKLTESSEGDVSTDGYITVAAGDVSTLNFFIKVQKREEFRSKYIHFTLLASTKEGSVRLEPGLAHYQTIPVQQTRDYVFQFQPKKQILLNFYTHNLQQEINILVKVSTSDEYDKPDDIVEYTISTESEVLDIQKVAEELCDTQQNCELFVRLQSKMQVELDVTVTLLIKDSIIQLSDGIWNSYHVNEIAKTSHFYFFPKHQNKSVTILYRSEVVDLKIMYNIWKTDDQSINPANWPFPTKWTQQSKSPHQLYHRPTQFIHIDTRILKKCWPNCVVLISIIEDDSFLKNRYNSYLQNSQFKIMASNNYIQIPEKLKVDVILKKGETKQMLVDLKYATDKNALTFFTYFTIGTVKLMGNVYDESNPRCPTQDDAPDFNFGNLQTQISMQNINSKLKDNDMNEDKNPYICILAIAHEDSKFSIEYSSQDNIMKQVMLDSFYTVKSKQGEVTILQVDGTQQFSLKITRTEGFPYISSKVCSEDEQEGKDTKDSKDKDKKDKKEKNSKKQVDFETCLQDFKSSANKGLQLADKMTSISQKPCERCIMFIKINSPEPSQVNLHVQSKYATTQLLQNQMITDELQKDDTNSYLITFVRKQELIINIQILHGDIEVSVNNFDEVNLVKKNEKGTNNIHITIPPKTKQNTNDTDDWGRTYFSMFDFSTFNQLYLTVRLQNGSISALYTITYSSGDSQLFLQDGLITTYALIPSRKTKFLYKNPSLSSIYLHLCMNDPLILNKLKIQILALNNEADEDSAVQITPEKPSFKKKTANPTMIMQLPPNKFFQIQITNPENTAQLLTIGINNQQIIYLPLNYEFPVQLKPNDYIYLVLSVPYLSFIMLQFKKCDESTLTLAYTLSYKDFIDQLFSEQQQMGPDELMTQLYIKTKQTGSTGTVYIRVKSSPEEDSLLTVKASISFAKVKKEKTRAGGKGLIEYSMLDSTKAQLSFDPLLCPPSNKNCLKDFSFVCLSAEKVESIYAQLVCSSFSFDLGDRMIIKPAETTAISTSNTKAGKITFQQTLKGDRQYVGVRGTNSKTGEIVYYKPVQMVTIWGMVSKGVVQGAVSVDRKTGGRGILLGVGVLLFLCVCLICYRRSRRSKSEYTPLSGFE